MSLGALLMAQGCATVGREPAKIVAAGPRISKTLSVNPQQRFLKRKVAIARFSDETKYGQGFFHDLHNDRIGKQAMDILSAKLAETGKFILLERADIDKINKELKMGGIGHLNIPADYLIVGSISEFGRKETSDVGVFSRVKKQEAYAKVNIRLVEVKTGQIIFSQEAAGEAYSKAGTVMGLGGHAGLDTSLNDKAIDAAISKLVSKVVENLLGKPWRAYVLSYQNGDYIISGGKSQGIRPGDMFTVYKKGQTVVNPQTNMKIELPGAKVGTIRVLST
ncbi:MAG TPA: CsgG/HfaB family protein, partial [Desulfuromonadales bacterium]|nr:CsgG/HfaB family protein [Desulfuromonadales bacterium]